MSRLFIHFRAARGGGGGGLVLKARVQFFLFKDLQGKICCTQMTWQSSSKTQLMDHSLLLISSHLFFFFLAGFIVRECAFGAKACSWAMAPERRTRRSLQRRLHFIEPELVSVFGELVKYNCVILYRAVLWWQRAEKLHYSAFYWGVGEKKREEGAFSGWWIMPPPHGVKVKHTHGGSVRRWRSTDHLIWNQFNRRIRAARRNGFYLMPINACIDLLI